MHSFARLAVVALSSSLVGCSCPPQSALGTLRANQRVLFEGQRWVDARCTTGAGAANCCNRHDDVCPDFTSYAVSDVRVKGARIAVLFAVNDGYQLLLSDDRGASWRSLAVGSLGNLAGFQQAALFLSGSEVYVMGALVTPTSGGTRRLVTPWRVDLANGGTARTSTGPGPLLSMTPLTDEDVFTGVLFAPDDARGSTDCAATIERWRPGSDATATRSVFPGSCLETPVTAGTSPTSFVTLQESQGSAACLVAFDATRDAGSTACATWGEWPAAPSGSHVVASWAGERAETLRAFEREGNAFVVSPDHPERVVPLGPGTPLEHRATSERLRYAGFVVLARDGGTSALVRVQPDGVVEEARLPSSPCEGASWSCFDPANADVARGGHGDTLWVEPLGGDEHLVLYAHDLAAGPGDFRPLFTASIEHATFTPVDTQGSTTVGPPGYPGAAKAGPIAEACIRRRTCLGWQAGTFNNCLTLLSRGSGETPRLREAIEEARSAPCGSEAMTVGWFECRMRGGVPSLSDAGFLECGLPADPLSAPCGTCLGDLAVTCSTSGTKYGVDCSAGGTSCVGGRCVVPGGCSMAQLACADGVGTVCGQNERYTYECGLLNMTCDAADQRPWSPCRATTTPPYAPTLTIEPRCEGAFLVWTIAGAQWADCRELGFSGCSGSACLP